MKPSVSREEIVDLTRKLVQCPSVNPPGDTGDCARIVLDKFKENGINAEIIQGKSGFSNVVATLTGREKGKVLLVNGHLDEVLPGENWMVPPFAAEIRDDRIYGRGSSDMKCGIASLAMAIIAIKRAGGLAKGEIIFTAVCDEETGGELGTLYLLKNGIGTNADFAIVAEPTTLKVELGNRGLRWIDFAVKGKAAHAGRPHLGVNAIAHAAKLVTAIHAIHFTKHNDAFDIPTPSISVTLINGGTKVNIIPERCEFTVDRRMLPGETSETILAELKEVIDTVQKETGNIHVETSVRANHFDPYLISEDEPVVQALLKSYQEVTGKKPEVSAKSSCTDASHIFHKAGIPVVLFGPGDERVIHGADEYVPIENFILSTEVYISTFTKLLTQPLI